MLNSAQPRSTLLNPIVGLLLLTISAAAPLHAASASIIRIWPEYKRAAELERISDYLESKPVDNTRLATKPESRDGFYFITRLDSASAQPNTTIELSVIAPTGPKPHTYSLKVDLPKGARTLYIGVTGADWPGPDAYPVAWLLTFRASDGTIIAQQKSFLWK